MQLELTQRYVLMNILLLAGILLVLYGFINLFVREYLETRRTHLPDDARETSKVGERQLVLPDAPKTTRHQLWASMGLLALIVLGGTFFRLDGLEDQTISHPEVYVPGIELPEGISEPPPRFTLQRTLVWNFHNEAHPQGYYIFMWVWTKLFGTDLFSLRLPSVLFGIGSIILIFRIASLSYGHTVGVLSAGLLAFNGHHIFWSQRARMYAMACFLGLVSTLLLLQLLRDTKKRSLKEALYVAVSLLGVLTQIYFWLLLAAQMLWTVVYRWKSGVPQRIVTLQAIIVILGAPLLAHAIYKAGRSHLFPSSLSFLQEYVSFGFLFIRDYWSDPQREIPALGTLILAMLTAVCIIGALRCHYYRPASPIASRQLAVRKLLSMAGGSIFIILGLAIFANRRQWMIALAGFVPMLALLIPLTLNKVWGVGKRFESITQVECPLFIRGLFSPFFTFAFIPFLILFGISFFLPLLAPRLLVLFTPYLLVTIAVGVNTLFQRPLLGISLAILLVVFHVSSVIYFRELPSSLRDYQDLAQKMAARIEDDDLIFVHRKSWRTTPMFYYLDEVNYQFVAEDFQKVINSHPYSRIWIIDFPQQPPTKEMRLALTGFEIQEQIFSRRGRGLLYVRRDRTGSPGITQSNSR